MALYVKNAEVDALAERLAARRNISKTEAVRLALQNELARGQSGAALVDAGLAFCRDLLRRTPAVNPQAADKAFIDSLYEGD